uniref:C2H2-type domain-containing protein n=2 Tax=Anopheles epiroticus TaxID=199890 RepID=A0A182PS07_9DIPT
LKPAAQPCICRDCWTSIHDFHLFYTKLESIHSDEIDAVNSTKQQITELEVQVPHQMQECVFDEHESKHTIDTGTKIITPQVVATYCTTDASESSNTSEKKHFVEVEDYASNDDDDDHFVGHSPLHDDDDDHLVGYSPLDDNVLDDDTLNTESKEILLLTTKSTKSNAKQPAVRGRGRQPKLKGQQPSETLNKIAKRPRGRPLTKTSTRSNAKQPASRGRGRPPKLKGQQPSETLNKIAQRPRGRPPKRKQDSSDDEQKGEEPQIVIHTSVTGTGASIKRRRERPPKKSFATDSVQDIAAEHSNNEVKNEIVSDYQPSAEESTIESESELDNDSDYEVQRQPPVKRKKSGRDERIFKYVDEFCCHYCVENVPFKRFYDADRHYKLVHSEPGFLKCPKCDKKCFTAGMFVSHMETHEDPEKNKCNICGKITDSNVSLKKHMRVHLKQLEENLPFPCSRCKRKFETEELRNKHEKLHVPKPPVKRERGPDLELLAFYKCIYCDVCEEQSPESTSCEVCKEVFQKLDLHMIKVHAPTTAIPTDKRYKCEQCGRMFNFLAQLKIHLDCVHGSKDVRCNVCNKYFNLKSFEAHKRTAHTDQMLMCEHCPKLFKSSGALKIHARSHDDSLAQFTACKLCNKQMKHANLKKHMTSQHSEDGPVSCELCGKSFRSMFHMKRHQKNTCKATIDSRPHKCEVCGKGFHTKLTMVEHMTTHTRTNQYQCAFCFKSFGYISNLQKHRKKAHPLEWQEIQARPEEGIASVIMVRN